MTKNDEVLQRVSLSQKLWYRLNREEGIAAAITTMQQLKDGENIGDKLITVVIGETDEPRTKEVLAELNIEAEIKTV